MIPAHQQHSVRHRQNSMIPACITAAVVLGGAVLVTNALFNLLSARHKVNSTETQLALAHRISDEITTLAATVPTASLGRRPTPGVVAQVGDALVLAGVPIDALTSLDSDENTDYGTAPIMAADGIHNPAAGARAQLRRQVIRLALEPLSMPQLARFLEVWRAQRPEWTITSIQITPQEGTTRPNARARGTGASPSSSQAPTAPPLRVHLVMDAAYVEERSAATTDPPQSAASATDEPK